MSKPKDHVRAIVKIFDGFTYRHDRHTVFADCIEAMAIAMSNAVDLAQREAREARYMEIARRYGSDAMGQFTQVLGELVLALESGPADILGEAFGAMELGNARVGQFFTPFEVCRLMARLQMGDDAAHLRTIIERKGFITAQEPACGAGAMIIALAEAMADQGLNYQQQLHVTAIDVDRRAAMMAYLQFSLLHIPAIVVIGNTLTLDIREQWFTPAHIIGGWNRRLAMRDLSEAAPDELAHPAKTSPAHVPEARDQVGGSKADARTGQLVLF